MSALIMVINKVMMLQLQKLSSDVLIRFILNITFPKLIVLTKKHPMFTGALTVIKHCIKKIR